MSSKEPANQPSRRGLRVAVLVVVANAAAIGGFIAVLELAGVETILSRGISASSTNEPEEGGVSLDGGLDSAVENADATSTSTVVEELNVKSTPSIKLGEPFYWRCWAGMDEGEPPLPEKECKRLKTFERAVASRMREVIYCYERLDGRAKGTLSLAVDVTFPVKAPDAGPGDGGAIRFWSGSSSDIEGADAIVACIRNKVEAIPLKGIRHKWQRYSIFFPIEFDPDNADESTETVELLLDRVRLRESPVDGKVVARLRRGEPLQILERGDGWVRVKTADNREGWVYSPAIMLQEQ